MNIVGEGFAEEIRKQIDKRQELKGKRDRNPGGNPQWLLWQNGNTGWVRMVSSVDVDPEIRYAGNKSTGSFDNASPVYYNIGGGNTGAIGRSLAKINVLVGGTKFLQFKNQPASGTSRTDFSYTERPFSGINRYPTDNLTGEDLSAYGYGGLEFGFQPMPGITSFNIKSENRGSLRTATVGIKAFNKFQFDAISTLYMSLGYSMLIEWGNTMYYDNNGKFHEDNQFSLAGEFIGAKYKWTEFLPEIRKYQLKSNGNYDAALCKVVNFNWKLNKDMSYDITITLRTVGDVIEALKINALSTNSVVTSKTKLLPTPLPTVPGQTNTSTTAQIDFLNKLNILNTTQPVNAQPTLGNVTFANSTDIGTFLQNHKDNIDNYGIPSLLSLSERYLRVGNDTIGFKELMVSKKGDGDVGADPYYIKLGYFLFLLETRIISNIKSNANLKAISIDYDTDTNIISIDEDLVSANPLSFTFKRTLKFSNGDTVSISPEGNDFSFRKNNNWYAYLMNAYVEVEWINKKLKELEDKNGNTVLIDFLNALCNEFCLATGNYNKLTTTIDNDTNTIRFTDEVSLPDRNAFLEEQGLPTIPANFHMYGYFPVEGSDLLEAGIVRDLSLVTTVSPRLASMISIGAQANGYAIGEDATALSALNRGLTDRIKEEFWYPGQTSSDPAPKTLEDQYPNVYKNFNEFIKKLGVVSGSSSYSNVSFRDWNFNDINTYLDTNRQFIEYRQAKATLEKQKTNPNAASSRTGFLPFNLSLTIDGLSGMKIYNRFTADTEYLPANYPGTIEFIITGLSHEIKDNQWITNIESLAVPVNPLNGKYQEPPAKKRGTNINPITPVQPTSNTAYSGPTPTLYKAVKDQSEWYFKNGGEKVSWCARYVYNIAYGLKKYLDTNSTQAVPTTLQSSGNADELRYRNALNSLGLYEPNPTVMKMTGAQLQAYIDSSTFNYGDVLNYYAPASGQNNTRRLMHAQIYTGNIFTSGINQRGATVGNSGWTTSTKTNYGSKFVYGRSSGSYIFDVYLFKVKSQYLK
jgi:hypothetical protein